jgi:peptidoglycan hydrolase-like protein with peptidoglycan-binding domain
MKRLVLLAAVLAGCGGASAAPPDHVDTATTKVVRQDLVETETVDGTLGYADPRTVPGKPKGVLTWTPPIGATIATGHRILQVAGVNVYLLDGTTPAYRTLQPGLKGDDVLQLERDLRALGRDPDREMKVDGIWDDGTTAAVKRWQDAKDLPETGAIELGRVVFAPGDRRIVSIAPLTTTSTRPLVTVRLDTDKAQLARTGRPATVELPSGKRIDGRIAFVGRVATKSKDGASVEVRITLGQDVPELDQAPVDVDLERSRRRDVLTVPLTALLARSGGGFAVEARDGAARRIVPVKPGLFTSGYVEIEGAGVRAGMTVSNAAL